MTMNQFKSDLTEMKSMILDLNRKLSERFDDHLNLIEQQRYRLERQQEQLSHQCLIIDELAWQIRDLRDSVRKCSEQISNQKCKKCNECLGIYHAKLTIPKTDEQSHHVSETSAIYESINYDETPTVVRRSKSSQRNTRNSLQRQDAIDGNEVKPNTNRDASSFLNNFIPPPPTETPPQRDEYDLNPVQISSETFEKLNSLYNSYEPRRTTFIGNDDTEDAVRLREFNNNYSARSYRGSSKAMCSYVSNVEDSYLPRSDDDDDNKLSNKFNDKSTNNLHADLKRTDNLTSPANDVVYI